MSNCIPLYSTIVDMQSEDSFFCCEYWMITLWLQVLLENAISAWVQFCINHSTSAKKTFPKLVPVWKSYSFILSKICGTQFFYHFGVGLKSLGLKSLFFNWTVKSGTEKFIFQLDCKVWDWKVHFSIGL